MRSTILWLAVVAGLSMFAVAGLWQKAVTGQDLETRPVTVRKDDKSVRVDIPATVISKDERGVRVEAPYSDVQVGMKSGWRRGWFDVLAPFVQVTKRPGDNSVQVQLLDKTKGKIGGGNIGVEKGKIGGGDIGIAKGKIGGGDIGVAQSRIGRGDIGVVLAAVPEALVQQLPDLKGKGLLITQVRPDSPAAEAGLKPNDVVMAVDKNPVSTRRQFSRLVAQAKPGQPLELSVLRSGRAENVTVEP